MITKGFLTFEIHLDTRGREFEMETTWRPGGPGTSKRSRAVKDTHIQRTPGNKRGVGGYYNQRPDDDREVLRGGVGGTGGQGLWTFTIRVRGSGHTLDEVEG